MSEAEFPILSFSSEELDRDEDLGTKTKYWFRKGEEHWLFKEPRENTGEDWAEKLAAEIAELMAIRVARVELAEYDGIRGSASLRFLDPQNGQVLIHGNEILSGYIEGYDRDKTRGQSDHTLRNLKKAIQGFWPQQETYEEALIQLVAYLVLDSLIGNTDRHHENWGMLLSWPTDLKKDHEAVTVQVAPTFDHASSLGRELQDGKRRNLLASHAVETYVRRGRGGVFLRSTDRHGANPLALVEFGADKLEKYFKPGLRQLKRFSATDLYALVDRIPNERMSDTAKCFTNAFLAYTYETLCKLTK